MPMTVHVRIVFISTRHWICRQLNHGQLSIAQLTLAWALQNEPGRQVTDIQSKRGRQGEYGEIGRAVG